MDALGNELPIGDEQKHDHQRAGSRHTGIFGELFRFSDLQSAVKVTLPVHAWSYVVILHFQRIDLVHHLADALFKIVDMLLQFIDINNRRRRGNTLVYLLDRTLDSSYLTFEILLLLLESRNFFAKISHFRNGVGQRLVF